ncbi:RNA polymerase subunit sigma [bacterium]|nr:RNA polymerase subunit sigma [bacterium]
MSGPIVRTGTNPKFWANYDKIFGSKEPAPAKAGKKATPKAAAPKKAVKKATKKAAKKK